MPELHDSFGAATPPLSPALGASQSTHCSVHGFLTPQLSGMHKAFGTGMPCSLSRVYYSLNFLKVFEGLGNVVRVCSSCCHPCATGAGSRKSRTHARRWSAFGRASSEEDLHSKTHKRCSSGMPQALRRFLGKLEYRASPCSQSSIEH
jgi:hypothetical protein